MDWVSNKCMCCGYDMGTAPYCKICGKSPVSIMGDAVDSQGLEQMARMYISNKLKGIRVLVRCYSYYCTEETVMEEGNEYVEICSADRYRVGDTFFPELFFEDLPSDREFTVDVRVSGNGADRNYSLVMHPTEILSHSRIGLYFTECMKARIVVGNWDNVCYSDEFELYIRV